MSRPKTIEECIANFRDAGDALRETRSAGQRRIRQARVYMAYTLLADRVDDAEAWLHARWDSDDDDTFLDVLVKYEAGRKALTENVSEALHP